MLASATVFLISIAPQIHLWIVRGSQWHGAYATVQGDEFLYSAYLNALINGRPRRNDPFAGLNSAPDSPLPETAFSIQFVPPLMIASLARASGASASTAFIILIGVGGFLAGLSLYCLFDQLIENPRFAAAGVLLVLFFGALAAGQGLIGLVLRPDVMFLGLPFLRRYQPAAALPLFFIFCALMWRALISGSRWRARLYSVVAGMTLAALIFSYLFLWTAAAAWFVCLGLLWLSFRPAAERWRSLGLFGITGVITICALVPYAYLVAHRAITLDAAQTLTLTHRPDLLRVPEIIAVSILLLLLAELWRQRIDRNAPAVILTLSFAVLPLVVFNQQIITGRSMQPYHFETFVTNYVVLVAFVLLAALLWRHVTNRSLIWIVILCFVWGAAEVSLSVLANYKSNIVADQMIPVMLRLKELAPQDGTLSGLRNNGQAPALVFSPDRAVMGWLPTWTSQGTLLGMGTLDFGSASVAERKELLYTYLYYSGADGGFLRDLLNQSAGDFFMSHYARIAIFGHERVVRMLTPDFKQITPEEIEREVKSYESFIHSFSQEQTAKHPLSYVVTAQNSVTDLSRIDRWYERDNGEQIGGYTLYRVRARK